MESVFTQFRIRAIATVVGGRRIRLDDEVGLYGGDRARIDRLKKATGLDTRHVVSDGVTSLDLAEDAYLRLERRTGIDRDSIDACVFVTQTPDHFQPANSALLHGRLGLPKKTACWDVNLGCSGWVYGLVQLGALFECGDIRRALLVAGDTISRQTDPEDRGTAPVFGDGAAVSLLERARGRETRAILGSDGAGSAAIRVPAGAFRYPLPTTETFRDGEGNPRRADCLIMDGLEVFRFSLREVPVAVRDLLEGAGVGAEQLSHAFFHQANASILTTLQRRLGLTAAQVPLGTLARYGNLSSASVPAVVCDTLSAPADSDAAGLSVLCGFGVGLSWGTALTDLSGVDCLPITIHGHPRT
ncbi:MAG: 3-oxoacyl-ACP synthase III family protein [Puniceicoccaceae bacterium]